MENSSIQTEAEISLGKFLNDPEAKSNLVGLFNLALKVAKRNPTLWAKINNPQENHD